MKFNNNHFVIKFTTTNTFADIFWAAFRDLSSFSNFDHNFGCFPIDLINFLVFAGVQETVNESCGQFIMKILKKHWENASIIR